MDVCRIFILSTIRFHTRRSIAAFVRLRHVSFVLFVWVLFDSMTDNDNCVHVYFGLLCSGVHHQPRRTTFLAVLNAHRI